MSCSPDCVCRSSALRAALADHEDVEVLRQLCAGDTVPEELRCGLWKELLGVSRRPDAIGSWSGPLDCSNQEMIHQHCQEQAGGELVPVWRKPHPVQTMGFIVLGRKLTLPLSLDRASVYGQPDCCHA